MAAILAGVVGFAYSLAFIGLVILGVAPGPGFALASALLMVGGILSGGAIAGLFTRIWSADAGLALVALLFGIAGAFGAAIHGGYDLAVTIHPPAGAGSAPDFPNEVDPRGLLTFGFAAIEIGLGSWLIRRGSGLPAGLGLLGYLSATLLAIIYLGRLIVFDPMNPVIAVPAALAGFIVNPAWYIWLGMSLRRS
jgi:hypothetical protein